MRLDIIHNKSKILRRTNAKSSKQKSCGSNILGFEREDYIEVAMEPGTKIDVQRLIEEFEVSETPVRVALAKLVHEGFVELLSRRGYFVIKLTKKILRKFMICVYCLNPMLLIQQ